MAISRDTVLNVLGQYLNGDIDKEKVYAWALEAAVSREYQEFSEKDPLAAKVVHALIDINHDDVKSIPTQRALEYYRQCLSGEKQYVPLSEIDLKSLGPVKKTKESAEQLPLRSQIRRMFRNITMAFGATVFLVFLIVFFIKGGPWAQDRIKVFVTVVPMMIYGAVLVLPPGILCRKNIFFLTFPVMVIGTAYFGSIVGQKIFDLSFPIMNKLILTLAVLVVPILAIGLVIKEKQWYIDHG